MTTIDLSGTGWHPGVTPDCPLPACFHLWTAGRPHDSYLPPPTPEPASVSADL